MKNRTSLKSTLLAIAGAAALTIPAGVARADFNPVALTQSSYTFSIVVPSNTLQAVPYCVNAFAGSGLCLSCDTTYYEQGMYNSYPNSGWNSGLPKHGTVFTNINNPNMTFRMPPDYTTNNDLMIVNNGNYGNFTSGTLTFATPTTATKLAILDTGGNGGATVSYIVTHTDNSTETGTFSVSDWFAGGGTVAWGANGRINQGGGYSAFNSSANNNNAPYLYASVITVSSATPIVSVTLNWSSGGGVDNFYAVSAANGTTTYTPVTVSGFNVISTVPALSSLPVTATMDNGTNLNQANGGLGNTWFEAGYYTNNTNYGLPPSGSTFASVSQPTHHYQMGNYSTNDAILIDTNHQTANITPANPSTYTGLAFLTAGGHIGTGNKMTNVCILQHADGVNETNVFFGYDWFEQSVPGAIAYEANGRISLNGRSLNTLGNQGLPYLFETYFTLSDITSPITNIVVKYKSAPVANATTFIMAVSGTTSPVPPVITQQPSPTNQTWYPSQSASISVLVSGSQPITYSWLVESNGVYVPLKDGTDANGSVVSGSSTTTLTISDLTLADGTNYEFMASNAEGTVTSTNATITINTGTPSSPIIDAQTPNSSFTVLTNHPDSTTFTVTVDPVTAPPVYYQWYSTSAQNVTTPIPNATSSNYVNVDTNNVSIYCVVSNFVGTAQTSPITISIVPPPAPSQFASAVLAYHPVGYWPLSETSGNIAFDYAGTNDGIYTGSCSLGVAGLPETPGIGANTAVGFDGSTAYVAIPGAGSLNITGPITVMEFVQTLPGADTGFTTPLGHSDQSYRLDVANGQPHWADSGPDIVDPNTVNDGNWHMLVGVYDGSSQYLYVDGRLVASPRASTPSGSTGNVTIGAAPDYLGARNFSGSIAQVAIIPSALNAGQIAQLYGALDTAPLVSITPANPNIFSGANVTLTANLSGTPATSLQWYVIDNANNSNNIPGATQPTYTIQNAPSSSSGYTYGIIAANAYGTNTATTVLTVQSSAPYLPPGSDLAPLNAEAYSGAPVTYTINALGSLPIHYQWSVNGTNVNGATSSSFTTTAACGSNVIQVSFTNDQSGGSAVVSSPAMVMGDAASPVITFNTNGTGWQLNTAGSGNVPTIVSNVLELTDNNSGEAASAFYQTAQYVGSFHTAFTYTAGGAIGADGVAFILQNSAANTNALGGSGGELGYGGITNSIALQLNIYGNAGIGMTFNTNGNYQGSPDGNSYLPTGNVNLASGDPINFVLDYANGVLSVTMTDPTASTSYSTSYNVGPLTPLLGGSDLAYVGFSGGDGGAVSIQTISNFAFNSVMPAVTLTATSGANNTLVLSWPTALGANYMLQQAASLKGPWSVGPAATTVGGSYQATVTVPNGAGQHFYRLVRVACD